MNSCYAVREFVAEVLGPAQVAWENARSGPDVDQQFASLALIEAYGWLRIGVQAGGFPRDIASELLKPRLDALLEASVVAEKKSLLEEGRTGEIRRLLTAEAKFPPSFAELFPTEFQHLPEAATVFSLWSTEARAFTESRSGTKLVKTLSFAHIRDWKMALTELKEEPFVSDESTVPDASLFEGYLRLLQHIDRVADLFTVEGIAPEQRPARAIMRIQVAGIHSWRFNFRFGLAGTRFDELTAVVADRLTAEAAAGGIRLSPQGFIDGVRKLGDRYVSVSSYLARQAEA
jgi:hypothetical protein